VYPDGLSCSAELGAEPVVFGRKSAPGVLQVEHATVSRRHLSIAWDAARPAHMVCDLGSRNGSWVDGAETGKTPRALTDNSVLRLGDVLLVYERGAATADDTEVSRDAVPGEAAAMRALRHKISRVAKEPSPVLVWGETGTGKEWVAGELHRLSGRRGKIVAVNCAALSPQLVESQLFGHVRGAFTGATEAQQGFFRAAHRGTLFLDEIGELPLEQQPKLLRVFEGAKVVPVGTAEPVSVDVRVIAATNRDLASAVESGAFRRDLYARLSLCELRVPPLRERRADLFDWIRRFESAMRTGGAAALDFSPDAAEALLLDSWPANLRGLQRLVHELCKVGGAEPIGREQLPAWLRPTSVSSQAHAAAEPERLPPPTRREFEEGFERLGGSVRALARHFGRDRRQIYRWIAAFGLGGRRSPR
jgi:DNA-binding NtrC family response regulator